MIGASGGRGQVFVAGLVTQGCHVDIVTLRGANPAGLRQYDRDRLGRQDFGCLQRYGGGTRDDRAAAIIAVFLRVFVEFLGNQLFQPGLGGQHVFELGTLGGKLGLLAANLHLFDLLR